MIEVTFNTAVTPDIYAIIGRKEIESKLELLPKNLVLISITDPNRENIKTNNHFKDELFMKFWDVDDDTSVGEYVTLTDNQAKEIYDFIQKNKGNKFIINCEMGHSRSAGVGVAIEWLFRDKFLCNKFSHFISNIIPHERYDYNKTVFNKIVSFKK